MSASAAPVVSVRENVPGQQVAINTAAPVVSQQDVMSASAAPVVSVRENVPGQQVINTAAPVVSKNVTGQQFVTSASAAQHEQSVAETEATTPWSPQSVSPTLAETEATTPSQSVGPSVGEAEATTSQSPQSVGSTLAETEATTPPQSVGPSLTKANTMTPWSQNEHSEVDTMSVGEISAGPACADENSTPPQEVETPSEGNTSDSPTSAHESSTTEWANITLILSDDETSVKVTKHDSSKNTLTSDMSTSRTDEELTTGLVVPIITIIEPVQEPPETPKM